MPANWNYFAPAAAAGVVYVARAEFDDVVALDAATGAERWRCTTPVCDSGQPDLIDGPALMGGLLYVANQENFVAVDTTDGTVAWCFEHHSNWGWSPPAVEKGSVYAVNALDGLYALDRLTGSLRWRFELDPEKSWWVGGGRIATVAEGLVFVDGRALDAETGEVVWQIDRDRHDWRCPVVSENRLYLLSSPWPHQAVHALDARTGADLWSASPRGSYHVNLPVTSSGRLFITDGVAIHALDATSGAASWRYAPDGGLHNWDRPNCAPVVAGDTLYVDTGGRGDTRMLLAINAETGREEWRFPLPSLDRKTGTMTVDEGVVYAPVWLGLVAVEGTG